MTPVKNPNVLTIAASDTCGGAGLQADLYTITQHHCHGLSVVTALTAQNTQGVTAIHGLPSDFIRQQFDAILSEFQVDAIKIGMLYDDDTIAAVATALKPLLNTPIIVDPVIVATSGARLLESNAIDRLKTEILPLTTLVTPNIPEAEALLNIKITTKKDMAAAAKSLTQFGSQSVLMKGGHLAGNTSPDCLYHQEACHWYESPRIETRSSHGTGCRLSSAIAANIAQGKTLPHAVQHGKAFVENFISP